MVQDGPVPVPGVHVIEGPATIVEGRVLVRLLCSTTAQFGPGNRMIDIRPMTSHDETVLKAIHRCDLLQARRDRAVEECKIEAAQQQLMEMRRSENPDVVVDSRGTRPAAQFLSAVYGERALKASYKTRGTLEGKSNKDRKRELFPELEDEISEA